MPKDRRCRWIKGKGTYRLSMYHCKERRHNHKKSEVDEESHLDITPPITPERASALHEIDFFVRVSVVEGQLVADGSSIAMERYTGKCVGCVLHLEVGCIHNQIGWFKR
jgi:hypothetical protein